MFPRDIRVAGRKYRTHTSNVSLITTRGKYYYSVKTGIQILDEQTTKPEEFLIFEDESMEDCAICFTEKKSVIVNPCGHFYMCGTCSTGLTCCPICRGPVNGLLRKEDME